MTRTLVKLSLFLLASVLSTVLVVNTLSQPLNAPANGYRAVFTDAQGLVPGSDVLIAGIRVGRVDAVRLVRTRAEVSFEITDDQQLPADAHAIIRYADLAGGRYLSITPGSGHNAGVLRPGDTIPVSRTRPALDLTALLNGFKPLFDAIDPKEVNQLAGEIVTVLQGQSGTIADLLNRLVAVTANLAGRDQVIGAILSNLNAVLDTMTRNQANFRALLTGLASLASAAAGDRQQIAAAIDGTAALAGSLSTLATQLRAPATTDLRQLNRAAGMVTANRAALDRALKGAPRLIGTVGKALDYGTWLNIYICNLSVSVGTEDGPGATLPVAVSGARSPVCQ
ncbi:MCE family protein [Fodinicola acaciae]|uniref:MCE family protein n=1 Tax=Fodinicola acaciae TaxID=2681555 RepID=UPI0013D4FA3D|nr:MCE family protein [Fodinicola acaciae]